LAIAEKNEEAFHRIYQRYSGVVYTLSLRITGQDHDAEDVVTEVFWELWDKSARYCPSKGSPYTYLIMLTRCRALDKKRGLTRNPSHPIFDWASGGQAIGGANIEAPEAGPLAAERRETVCQALQKLDQNQRQAIELTFFDGLTHKATAEKLGIPLGTVKGRVRAAVDRLRMILNASQND
jgi:RNA polymerase sigma-70 factor (ECF subfamily)